MKIRRWVTLLVVVALVGVALFITAVHVATSAPDDPALTETRYCGDPKRNLSGEIIRRAAVRDAFQRIHPCPSNGNREGPCPGWRMNHTVPLKCNGCDSVGNLSWVPTILKAGPGSLPVDRWERKVYCADQRELVTMPDPQKFRLEAVPQ